MLKRFSISLEETLLNQFDEYIHARSYINRSEAIRDLIRSAFVRRDWEENGNVTGVISLVYDHSRPQLQSKVTQLQHDCHEQIISATHVHVDHENCLEVIIVSGTAGNISALADGLSAVRGVRNCSLSMTETGTAVDSTAPAGTHSHSRNHT